MQFELKKIVPHAVAVALFLIVSLLYCKPVLEGKVVNQHDNLGWKGMAQQSFEYKEKHGRFPLWTNSMFSGMPAYQIAMDQDYPVSVGWLSSVLTLGLPKPVNFFFLASLCFYLLCMAASINPWISMAGALSYAYATYNPVIIAVGHDTKMLAIGYAPLVIAGFLLLFRKQWGFAVAALGTGIALQMSTGHLQIVYYTLLISGALFAGFILHSILQKNWKTSLISLGLSVFIGIIGFATNAHTQLTTYEYSKESMRGGISELKDTNNKNVTAGGLDKDYAFRWSYGISETLTLLVPGLYGGSNGGDEYQSSKLADKLTEIGYPEDQALMAANQYSYWGEQPGTSGPVYIGAIICILFMLSLFIESGWIKWSLVAAGVFGIVLAWGKNLESVNYFLFDYLPFYKKFRAPSMGLFIPGLSFTLLACMTLHTILFGNMSREVLLKKLKSGGIAAGILVAAVLLFYFNADFKSKADVNLQENMSSAMLQQSAQGQQPTLEQKQEADAFGKSFTTALQEDRKELLQSDLTRTLFLIGLVGLLLVLFMNGKLKPLPVVLGILVLTSYDLLTIGKRYLNDRQYVDDTEYESTFTMTEADQLIKQDKEYYRVYNQTGDPFNESRTSYFHNSIGGYHPAKLQLYQDLIENQISKNNMQVFNMLNTRYFILPDPQSGKAVVQKNPDALGAVWFVKGIRFVENGNEEMKALDKTALKDTAVVQQKFKSAINQLPAFDSTAKIQLLENDNDIIRYESNASTPQFAVMSEIYYPRGWNAYIDGQKSEYVKTNYALRGISIPAGKHRLEFKFEPTLYKTGNLIMLIATILLYMLVIGGLWIGWKEFKKTEG